MDFDPKKDYYKILGLSAEASEKEIKSAYYKMAKKYHPDLNGGKQSNEFKEMTNAYDILSDEKKKQDYDAMRKGNEFQNSSFNSANNFYNNSGRNNTHNNTNSNHYQQQNNYYNHNFEEKIREKFRRAGFENAYSKYRYKDPKTGEWKSYSSGEGNPFFKDFEDLFNKSNQNQQNRKNYYYNNQQNQGQYSNYQNPFQNNVNNNQYTRNTDQFYNEDLNDPNRFSNKGYNPYTQSDRSYSYSNQNDFNNFNYDYSPILMYQFFRRVVIIFGLFMIISYIYKKKAKEDFYFNNGYGNGMHNFSYSQYANPHGSHSPGIFPVKIEEEIDPYDPNSKIRVK